MAGAGYKLFNTGDVLTAAQVNTYLMQQTTMVFASAAARTSALSGVLAEGMVSYLQDTNTLEVYDGSSWVGATGDITGLTAGTGITITSATGPVPTVTNDVATTFDAKGDLVVGTGADTFNKLTVGNNGETLVADSSTGTGLRYNPQNALANPIINGGMDIWQRGTTSADSAGSPYTADRWQLSRSSSSGATVTRQVTGDTTNLPNIQYCARVQRNSGNTSTNLIYFSQSLESTNSIPFAGKTITFSFYARAGANYSSASSSMSVQLSTGTGTDQSIVTGFTGTANPISTSVTLTTSWQRFAFTGTISATATQLAVLVYFAPSGTAGANDYFEVTGMQIDLGTYTASTAPTFRRSGGTLAGELAACQRYYTRLTGGQTYSMYGIGFGRASGTAADVLVNLPVTMRVIPTVLEYGNLQLSVPGSAATTITSITTPSSSDENSQYIGALLVGGTVTAAKPYFLGNANNAAGYIAFGAEL